MTFNKIFGDTAFPLGKPMTPEEIEKRREEMIECEIKEERMKADLIEKEWEEREDIEDKYNENRI